MLEIVEEQQARTRTEEFAQASVTALDGELECIEHRNRDLIGGSHRRERHEIRSISERRSRCASPRDLQGQPSLADSRRPREREQPHVRPRETPLSVGELAIATDQWRRRRRKRGREWSGHVYRQARRGRLRET